MISDISLTDGVIRNSEWVLAPTGTETYKTLYTMKLKCYELFSKPVEAGGWNFQLQTSSKRSRYTAQELWCLLEKCADKWSLRADKTLFYSPLSSETDLNIPFTRLKQVLPAWNLKHGRILNPKRFQFQTLHFWHSRDFYRTLNSK